MSEYAEQARAWHEAGAWQAKQLRLAVRLGRLTEPEYEAISGEPYAGPGA